MGKGDTFLMLFLIVSLTNAAIIPSTFIIQSAPNYRGQIILRYFELQRHNILRSRHNSQLLKLNSVLSKRAQTSAERLLRQKEMNYSPEAMSGFFGENIYCAFSAEQLAYTPQTATDYWYSQEPNYDYATGKSKDPSHDIGQFSSMVWNETTEVGFGYAYGKQTINGASGYLMCVVANYYPTPNIVGKFTSNIKPLAK